MEIVQNDGISPTGIHILFISIWLAEIVVVLYVPDLKLVFPIESWAYIGQPPTSVRAGAGLRLTCSGCRH